MRVASLHMYPVKGMRAVACEKADVTARGLAHDRRWLVTDENDRFLTQRECGGLARLRAAASDEGLRIENGEASIEINLPAADARRSVTVWNDDVEALFAGDEAARWLSDALGRSVRLYHMDEAALRTTSGRWGPKTPVSFADAYPVLIVTKASLDALNDAIVADGDAPLPMERFRPNIVIDGADAWAEDYWRTVEIGGVTFDLVKPSDRCVVTTIDQASGEKTGRQPLKTLRKIRLSAHPNLDGVLFGWNAVPRGAGEIKAGDPVEVIEEREGGWPLVRD